MLEQYREVIKHLRRDFVEACKSVFGENLVSIITKGSTVKGGFIPELSDVDLHVYLKSTKRLAQMGREFYESAIQRDRIRTDLEFCKDTIRLGSRIIDLGRQIGIQNSQIQVKSV